jgi:MOSC domain-containing protein YiiM
VPRDSGLVHLLVQRPARGERRRCEELALDPERGVVGDRWWDSWPRKREAMVTLMRHDVALALGDGQDPALLGDNIFADIDTSSVNLPPGSRLRLGEALCEVTPKAHTGCSKFAERVGQAALELTRDPVWRWQNLRGLHLLVLEGGRLRRGDHLQVLSRA